ADQQLAAAPKPKHVRAAQLSAMKIAASHGRNSPSAQQALYEAEQLKAKREAALAEHAAAMSTATAAQRAVEMPTLAGSTSLGDDGGSPGGPPNTGSN